MMPACLFLCALFRGPSRWAATGPGHAARAFGALIAGALALAGCAGTAGSAGRWQQLTSLYVTGKTAPGERVSVLEFCQPERVEPVLARLRAAWPPGLSSAERAQRLLGFVQQLPAAPDPDDLWQMPGETLIAGGDCEDKAFLLVSLLAADGLEPWVMVGSYHERDHTWVALDLPGRGMTYLETLDRTPRLRAPSGAYVPWGRWNAAGRIEEWVEGGAVAGRE